MCHSIQPVHEVLEEELQQDTLFMGVMGEVKEHNTGWHTHIGLNGEMISFKTDTGTGVTAIPKKLYEYSRDGPLRDTNKKLYGPNNTVLQVTGQITCQLKDKNGTVTQPVFVVDSLVRPLLGLPAVEALRLVERVDEREDPGEMFKNRFPTVFVGLGRLVETTAFAGKKVRGPTHSLHHAGCQFL